MDPYKHSPFDEEMVDAMLTFNTNKPSSEKFNLIDTRIISLVHSYTYSGKPFFASNKHLAERCFATVATIQKSINKLYAYGLIDKKVFCTDGRKQRILTYNESGAQRFKNNPLDILPRDAWEEGP